MARPREFNQEELLAKAGAKFWHTGYQATSIQTIAKATGVNPGSLYKAFGDKKALFLACVEQYMETLSYKTLIQDDSTGSLRDSMRKLFDCIIASSTDEDRISGCLVTNAAFELSTVSPDIAEELKLCLAGLERVLWNRIAAAQERGEIGKRHSADTLTSYYLTVVQGLLISSRISKDQAAMELAADAALSLLDHE